MSSTSRSTRLLASVQRRLPCSETKAYAEKHLGSIRKKIAELRALEATVTALVRGGEATCSGSAAPDCVILQAGEANCG
ncbi:MerR family DNA-binding protein [Bradyrhizobium sp. AS23.2]|uniref:MerR family DNA-binding protein n=1 Tax=Bradyrhizobium sp. AS23.2 TaxID=1680155 RepID=UPI00093D71E0|nr:MerR family DNA-binding protein [Bradyrhizobium sp. AS23.2]OKO71825.1 hypothetical protein AC630_31955 [Bradyrhizobium sp. AS23.2]